MGLQDHLFLDGKLHRKRDEILENWAGGITAGMLTGKCLLWAWMS